MADVTPIFEGLLVDSFPEPTICARCREPLQQPRGWQGMTLDVRVPMRTRSHPEWDERTGTMCMRVTLPHTLGFCSVACRHAHDVQGAV